MEKGGQLFIKDRKYNGWTGIRLLLDFKENDALNSYGLNRLAVIYRLSINFAMK